MSVFRAGATAVITGAAGGIGFAFAKLCRQAGMNVVLLDFDTAKLDQAASVLATIEHAEARTSAFTLDVTDIDAYREVKNQMAANGFMTIDLLILNAGAGFRPTTDQSWEDLAYFQKTMNVNVNGVLNGLATFLPVVQQSGDNRKAIVITGSKQGITNPPGNPAYNASKAALNALAQHLCHDLRTESSASYSPTTSVHLLVPGWTFTGLSGHPGPAADEAAVLAAKPAGAWLPEQVAEYGRENIEQGNFWILCPDGEVTPALDHSRMLWHVNDAIQQRSPMSRWDARYKEEAAAWIAEETAKRSA